MHALHTVKYTMCTKQQQQITLTVQLEPQPHFVEVELIATCAHREQVLTSCHLFSVTFQTSMADSLQERPTLVSDNTSPTECLKECLKKCLKELKTVHILFYTCSYYFFTKSVSSHSVIFTILHLARLNSIHWSCPPVSVAKIMFRQLQIH